MAQLWDVRHHGVMMTPKDFMTKLQRCKTQQALIVVVLLLISAPALVSIYIHVSGLTRAVFVICWLVLLIFIGQFSE
jgi:hypothetical protein